MTHSSTECTVLKTWAQALEPTKGRRKKNDSIVSSSLHTSVWHKQAYMNMHIHTPQIHRTHTQNINHTALGHHAYQQRTNKMLP